MLMTSINGNDYEISDIGTQVEQFLFLKVLPFTLAHIDVKIEDHTSDLYSVLRDPMDSGALGRNSIFMMQYIILLGSYSIFVR